MSKTEAEKLTPLVEKIKGSIEGAVIEMDTSLGDMALTIEREKIRAVLAFLKEKGFNLLLDIGCVDRLNLGGKERFEVVYILYSISSDQRLRLKVLVPESDLALPTATDLWKAANWAEREAFDMFGVQFTGHPHLKRILCHHEFGGHALRKDYPIMKGQWCSDTQDMREDLEKE